MPYTKIEDLPDSVQHVLPMHALEIYLSAFNSAWCRFEGNEKREQISHKIAWAAVKRTYEKVGGIWVERDRDR